MVGYQGPCCLHLHHKDGSSTLLPHHYMVSHSRGPWHESSSPWKYQFLYYVYLPTWMTVLLWMKFTWIYIHKFSNIYSKHDKQVKWSCTVGNFRCTVTFWSYRRHSEEKRPLGWSRHRWKDSIKNNIREMGWEHVDKMCLMTETSSKLLWIW